MKLLRMHVDNFGGLHDYDFSFEDGMNIILEENGYTHFLDNCAVVFIK